MKYFHPTWNDEIAKSRDIKHLCYNVNIKQNKHSYDNERVLGPINQFHIKSEIMPIQLPTITTFIGNLIILCNGLHL